MQKLKFNSKRQEELYNLITELEYASYPVLKLLLQDKDRKLFKKNFKFLHKDNYIKVVKVGNKVYAFPASSSESFNEQKIELFNWFYLKVIRSGGKLLKDENKIITATEHEFTYDIIPEINAVKLYGKEVNYIATLKQLKNIFINLGDSLSKTN